MQGRPNESGWLPLQLWECGNLLVFAEADVRGDSSLALVNRDDCSPKAKHFATRLVFVRGILQDERRGVKLDSVATVDNEADLFTKGLGKSQQQIQQLSAK